MKNYLKIFENIKTFSLTLKKFVGLPQLIKYLKIVVVV